MVLLLILAVAISVFKYWQFEAKRKRRRDYYRNEYLKSEEWQRKRYVVLKRDNWRCVYCSGRATQVHHKKYAKRNIGREPIKWLVSICKSCHDSKHR
jgi:5-methylcytosine-specific restriction endonuclease McrA